MKTYVIEREIPGASELTHTELRGITSTSNDAVQTLDKPYVELVLSTRTVDMHVRNILTKLRCRSRTEAAAKAGELGLLA